MLRLEEDIYPSGEIYAKFYTSLLASGCASLPTPGTESRQTKGVWCPPP